MSIDSLYPFAGDHAIQNAAFAVDFDRALTSDDITDMEKAMKKAFADEFPQFEAQQSIAINFQSHASAQQTVKAVPNGFVMQRANSFPGAFSRSLTLSPQNFLVTVNDYSRWENVKHDIDRYFDVVLGVLHKVSVPVAALGLQYWDVFSWKADPSDLHVSEVFNAGTRYLVPHVLEQDAPTLWHSHHGYFIDHVLGVQIRQLDNINVSRVEISAGQHQIQIVTSHNTRFATPLWKASDINRNIISDIQIRLHQDNKKILANLLTQAVQNKIKLAA